jgi:hypothetical protein
MNRSEIRNSNHVMQSRIRARDWVGSLSGFSAMTGITEQKHVWQPFLSEQIEVAGDSRRDRTGPLNSF